MKRLKPILKVLKDNISRSSSPLGPNSRSENRTNIYVPIGSCHDDVFQQQHLGLPVYKMFLLLTYLALVSSIVPVPLKSPRNLS